VEFVYVESPLIYGVGPWVLTVQSWVWPPSSGEDVTREREFAGDIDHRRRRLPHIVRTLRDLIQNDWRRVDNWGAGREDWGDVGLMSHDKGFPTGFLSLDCGTVCSGCPVIS
jgi:hypothetical protein